MTGCANSLRIGQETQASLWPALSQSRRSVPHMAIRAARDREPDGLPAAASRRGAGNRVRDAQRALQAQSARCEGRRRGRCHRVMPGDHERDHRRAVACAAHFQHRHAGHTAPRLVGDQHRSSIKGPSRVQRHPVESRVDSRESVPRFALSRLKSCCVGIVLWRRVRTGKRRAG